MLYSILVCHHMRVRSALILERMTYKFLKG